MIHWQGQEHAVKDIVMRLINKAEVLGDTRELKAALRKLLNVAQGLLRGEAYDMAGPKFLAIFVEAERLLGEPTKSRKSPR